MRLSYLVMLAAALLISVAAAAAESVDLETLGTRPSLWPKEVALTENISVAATATTPVRQLAIGSVGEVISVQPQGIGIDFNGIRLLVPVAKTDFFARLPQGATSAPEKSGKRREASRPETPAAGAKPTQDLVQLVQLAPGIHQETALLPSGQKLRYTISIPAHYDSKKPVPLIVALHYGGEVTPFYGRGMIDALVGPALENLGAVIVAPDSLAGSWATESNAQAVVWLARSILKSYAIDPKKVLLTGFSMGGQGTWSIGGRNQTLFTAAIPVAGNPAEGIEWKIPVLVIHSQKDEVIPIAPVRNLVQQMKSRGMKIDLRELTDLTHFQTDRYVTPLRETIPWLQQAWK